jgi:hypothetical protein
LVLGAVALVVVLAVAGLYFASGSRSQGPAPQAGTSTGNQSGTGTGSGSGTEVVPPSQPPTEVAPGQVPSGFRSVSGQGGITLAVPADWPDPQSGSIPGTDQVGPDGGVATFIRYGALTAPDTDLLTYLQGGERTNPNIATDFERIHLDPISYAGADEAYDWEFTFTKNGEPRHVRACYWTYGGRLYLVYGSAPAAGWPAFASVADVAIHSAQL